MYNNNRSNSLVFWSVIALATALFSGITSAQGNGGNPFGGIQDQLDQQQAHIDQQQVQLDLQQAQIESLLSSTNDQVEFGVDCFAGDTITEVLDDQSGSTAPITILISGVCNESVDVVRDNIALIGVSSGAGITSISDSAAVTVSNGASGVSIDNLTINGGAASIDPFSATALLCTEGAEAEISNSTFSRTSGVAIRLFRGSVCSFTDSVAENSTFGLIVGSDSHAQLVDFTSRWNSARGINVGAGGYIRFSDEGAIGNVVNDNGNLGMFVGYGAIVAVENLSIENHSNVGAAVSSGGTLLLSGRGAELRVTNNSDTGIRLNDSAILVSNPTAIVEVTGHTLDLECIGVPTIVANLNRPTINIGNIDPNCPL